MNRTVLIILLAISLIAIQSANAQFLGPKWGYGVGIGGARGDNAGSNEEWRPHYRAMLQTKLIPQLSTQLGVGYTELFTKSVYSTQTIQADVRLLYSPFQLKDSYPFFYAGFGATKEMKRSGTGYLPLIPAGVGIQTAIGEALLLQVHGGYNLSLSDDLDGRVRYDNSMNSITNGKHDGFFELTVGLVFGNRKAIVPSSYRGSVAMSSHIVSHNAE